ncbi:MAG: sulfurtransferase-like selenium metabolism protein YedF [Myxococcota bacterium]
MKQTLDARGLACPQPVVLTRKATATADHVTVIVDNAVAVENVTRFARSQHFAVHVSEQHDGVYLDLRRDGALVASPSPVGTTVLFVTSDRLGDGPAELGERLLAVLVSTLLDTTPRPTSIIFMNSGVKLAVRGSRALDDLVALANEGVDVLACGTCLDYYELTQDLAVGRVSNMYDIATMLLTAGRLVRL